MADVYEKDLAQKSSLTTSDYIRVVGSDNASYKQLVSDVAKKIIENYTGSSLAGSSQSVKSALDALNSKWLSVSSGSMKSITSSGVYYVTNGVSDKPTASGGMLAIAFGNASTAAGLYVANTVTQQIYWVTVVNGIWTYHTVS